VDGANDGDPQVPEAVGAPTALRPDHVRPFHLQDFPHLLRVTHTHKHTHTHTHTPASHVPGVSLRAHVWAEALSLSLPPQSTVMAEFLVRFLCPAPEATRLSLATYIRALRARANGAYAEGVRVAVEVGGLRALGHDDDELLDLHPPFGAPIAVLPLSHATQTDGGDR
jgi:hypothetical protein